MKQKKSTIVDKNRMNYGYYTVVYFSITGFETVYEDNVMYS